MIVWSKENSQLKIQVLSGENTVTLLSYPVMLFPYENFCKISCHALSFEKTRLHYGQCAAFLDVSHQRQGRILIEKEKLKYRCFKRKHEIVIGKEDTDDICLKEDFGSLRIYGDQFQGFHHFLDISHNGKCENGGVLEDGDELLFYPLALRFEKEIVFVRECNNVVYHLTPYAENGSDSVGERNSCQIRYGYEPDIHRNLHLEIKQPDVVHEMQNQSYVQMIPSLLMACSMLSVSLINSFRYENKDTVEVISALLLPLTMLATTLMFPVLMHVKEKRTFHKKTEEINQKFQMELKAYHERIEAFKEKYLKEISFLTVKNESIYQCNQTLYLLVGICHKTLQIDIEKKWQSDTNKEEMYNQFLSSVQIEPLPCAFDLFAYDAIVVTGTRRKEYANYMIHSLQNNSLVPMLFYIDEKDESLFYLRSIANTFQNGMRCITGEEKVLETYFHKSERCICFLLKKYNGALKTVKNQILVYITEERDVFSDLCLDCEETLTVQDYRNHVSYEMQYLPVHNKEMSDTSHNCLSVSSFHTDFLAVHNCKRKEELNIYEQYRMNSAKDCLKGVLGIDERGNQIILDLHENKDGPHGIVAGMTGSGKSELLLSYVLSLCCNYSSKELQFAFIDFKGGGLATILKDLPHTAGILSNLDNDSMDRALHSFTRICTEREKLLLAMHEKCGMPISNLNDYRSHFQISYGLPYIADLVIIVDEFAELKKARPEDMKNLISIARIGRSLGLHLILCTQKPSGVINEEILANCSFRIVLKVSSKSDSYEVCGSYEASLFQEPGQFLLKTSSGITRGNGSYASCSMNQDGYEIAVLKPDGSISETSNKHNTTQQTQLMSILEEIKKNNSVQIEPLWQQPVNQLCFKDVSKDVFALIDDEMHNQYLSCKLQEDSCLIVTGDHSRDALNSILLSAFLLERKVYVYGIKNVSLMEVDYTSEVTFENASIIFNGLPFENDDVSARLCFSKFLSTCKKRKIK